MHSRRPIEPDLQGRGALDDLVSTACAGVALVYTAVVVWFAHVYAHFWGDDLSTFLRLEREPLWTVVWSHLGGQFVPWHRLVNAALHRLCPMNFDVALALLVACHGLGVLYLHRLLHLLAPGRTSRVLVALYAVHPLAGVNLLWFTSGLTRYPYVACILAALFHYLAFAQTRRTRHLAFVFICYAIGIGFYAKTIFLPVYLAGTEVAARSAGALPPPRASARSRWASLLALAFLGVVYVISTRHALHPDIARVNTDVVSVFTVLTHAGEIFLGASVDYAHRESVELLTARVLVVGAVVALLRAPRTAVTLVVLLVLLVLNFGLLAISSRVALFGAENVAADTRYHYELWVWVILLGRLVLCGLPKADLRSPIWVRPTMAAVLPLLVLLHAVNSLRGYGAVALERFWFGSMTRSYVTHLLDDLHALPESELPARVVDAPVPRYLSTFDLSLLTHADLFAAIGAPARGVAAPRARYRVTPDGHLVTRSHR